MDTLGFGIWRYRAWLHRLWATTESFVAFPGRFGPYIFPLLRFQHHRPSQPWFGLDFAAVLLKDLVMKITLSLVLLLWCAVSLAAEIDRVVVNKSQLRMYLMSGPQVMRTYEISLGENPIGHKEREGDEKTPEGLYVLDYRNPESRFYKSIHVSYPNRQDLNRAKSKNLDPGGNIFIHGLPNNYDLFDRNFFKQNWTDGCIAVNNNEQMDEIWQLVKDGTPIKILP